jgi:hypothetical protein
MENYNELIAGNLFIVPLAEAGEFGGVSATHVAEPVEGSLMLPRLVTLAGGCGGGTFGSLLGSQYSLLVGFAGIIHDYFVYLEQ